MSDFDTFLAQARELRSEGLSFKAISARLKFSDNYIAKALRDPDAARRNFKFTRQPNFAERQAALPSNHVYQIIADYPRIDLAARAAGVLRRAAERRS